MNCEVKRQQGLAATAPSELTNCSMMYTISEYGFSRTMIRMTNPTAMAGKRSHRQRSESRPPGSIPRRTCSSDAEHEHELSTHPCEIWRPNISSHPFPPEHDVRIHWINASVPKQSSAITAGMRAGICPALNNRRHISRRHISFPFSSNETR